ncbi:secreted acidic protein 1A-like [Capsicum annuum]|uniref:secreted acidic protein 1A-like n=1 Tax=Capsicum annuum TaxID=4072 RepID=UPI001FB17A53|nr:secreted acidic protein 1A-like [Capsicum annuum]
MVNRIGVGQSTLLENATRESGFNEDSHKVQDKNSKEKVLRACKVKKNPATTATTKIDETVKVVALLVVGASADVVLGVDAESLVVVESVEGEGGDDTSSSSGDDDDDDDDLGDWVGALPLLLLIGAIEGDVDGELFGDDDEDEDGDNDDGDKDGDDDGDKDGALLGDVASETNPAKATNMRAITIT